MAIKAEDSERNIMKSIEKIISRYSNLISNLSKYKDSKINKELWEIRSDLEFLIVEIKYFLKKDIIEERWQKTFLNDLKGTGSKPKAIPMLSEYSKAKTSIITLFTKDKEKCYKYLWKLKETITVVLAAFPTEKFSFKNGKLVKESEEIFEI
ncbi:MAG: hypothetical protein ACTSVO_13855 [Candidatus Heimdallarchaeaceae archaeon]